MFQVSNLTIVQKKDNKIIHEDFSCVFSHGDKVALIGEEGNGKTTILKWMYNPQLIQEYCDASGSRILNDETIGYLPQGLNQVELDKSVFSYLFEDDDSQDISVLLPGICWKLTMPVEQLYTEKKMREFSGGEQIKIQLIKLLCKNPTVLLLDEPTNDLDKEALEWLGDFVNSWDGIVIFVSHDEVFLTTTATRIIHFERLKKKSLPKYSVVNLSYREYVEERERRLSRQTQQATNDLKEKKERDEKCRRLYSSVEYHQANLPKCGSDAAGRLLKKKMHVVKSMERRYQREDLGITAFPDVEDAIYFRFTDKNQIPKGKDVLRLSISKLYVADSDICLAQNIDMFVRGPEKIFITGSNGVGKSTLLREINKVLQDKDGINAGYMPQDYNEELDYNDDPIHYLCKYADKCEQGNIPAYLGSMKFLAEEMHHPISQLSEGQKAKLFFLKFSLQGCNVLLLDEPTRNLSPLSGPVVRKMLSNFMGTVICVTHDRKLIDEVAEKVYLLSSDGLTIGDRL